MLGLRSPRGFRKQSSSFGLICGVCVLAIGHGNTRIIESYNHGMAWVEKDLKDHLVSTSLQWAGPPTTRPGCPEPQPLHNHSGQPVLVRHHPLSKKLPLNN